MASKNLHRFLEKEVMGFGGMQCKSITEWHTPVALRRLGRWIAKNLRSAWATEFKTSLTYMVRPCLKINKIK